MRLDDAVRRRLASLAVRLPVGIVSGRALGDLRRRVALDGIDYAGSHGFELYCRDGTTHLPFPALKPRLERAGILLVRRFRGAPEVTVERKPFAIAVHYRKVPARGDEVQLAAAELVRAGAGLRMLPGKAVIDLLPDVAWDKGSAVRWFLDRHGSRVPLYAGDDTTDEDAFTVLPGAITVLVATDGRPSAARYRLAEVAELHAFLAELDDRLPRR